jgi:transposase
VHVRLKKPDNRIIADLLKKGRDTARVFKRAMILQLMNGGASADDSAARVGTRPDTARRVARRYQEAGLQAALHEMPRRRKKRLLAAEEEQRIIALACSTPPAGIAQWSVRLLADEAVKQGIVTRVGKDTVHRLLKSHDLKPWLEKNVVRRKTR